MATDRDDDDGAAWPRGGRTGWSVTVWQFVGFVAATIAGAAYLCGECCEKASRAAEPVTLVGHPGAVRSVAYRADGAMLGSVGADGSILLWDLDRRLARSMPPVGPSQDRCLAFSPDGGVLAAGSDRGPVVLHDLEEGRSHVLSDPSTATVWRRMPGIHAGWPSAGRRSAGRADHALGSRFRSGAVITAGACRGRLVAGG